MRADLAFESAELEAQFSKLQTERNLRLTKQFHIARALAWAAILLRVLASEEHDVVGWLALGTLSSLAPAFINRLLPDRVYRRWRIPIQVADNVLQVLLGCYVHHTIYPSPNNAQPSAFQMVAVMLTGNGVAWLLFCSLWGSLPFRYALPQQAGLTILLLLFNTRLCQQNVAVQLAYTALQSNLAHRAQLLLGPLLNLPSFQSFSHYYEAGRSCSAAVLAAPQSAREAVRQACIAAAGPVAAPAAAAAGEAAAAAAGAAAAAVGPQSAAALGAELCMRYQPASLLLLGFILPTACIFFWELRMRRAMLAQHMAAAAEGRTNGRAAGGALEESEHVPGFVEYLYFAVPALAAMWTFAALAIAALLSLRGSSSSTVVASTTGGQQTAEEAAAPVRRRAALIDACTSPLALLASPFVRSRRQSGEGLVRIPKEEAAQHPGQQAGQQEVQGSLAALQGGSYGQQGGSPQLQQGQLGSSFGSLAPAPAGWTRDAWGRLQRLSGGGGGTWGGKPAVQHPPPFGFGGATAAPYSLPGTAYRPYSRQYSEE
ncbi:hypothetical protein C2E21_7338 [Chlorella sorokiniana]|uniref:Uncharacterized protein n=1 Tax=Chlorella sorokiniana TaxID=3076 RepID=A0A2P6THU5_CHLSO|nr:hypothetical protein C2E21_7338 [Chlorella sorokiniana]|eukprot:PRW33862.1 hypothetical protein C2E21_7338 [Chlorella sorokiniana]